MTNEQRMNLLRTVFNAIFQSKASNTDITQMRIQTNTGIFAGRWFVNGLLRGFDFTCNLGNRIISIRCLEQNPNKTDNFGNLKKFAALARQGHQIMWVIDRNTDSWLGRMHNSEWHPSFQPATQPASAAPVNTDFKRVIYADGRVVTNYADGRHTEHMADNRPADYYEPPETQVPAEYQTEPVNVGDLPELPEGAGIPDYILQEMGEMDEEPPDWGEYETY
jgi:hypothetical protein